MEEQTDLELARRVRDILAVATDDLDAVTSDVEDGIVYIEGVVPTDDQRRAISSAVRQLEGVNSVITCLATEHVLPSSSNDQEGNLLYPAPVYMHYYSSLS
jgi:osmotically-inducible protein OsmY